MTGSWWGVGSGSCLLAGDLERLFAEMEDVMKCTGVSRTMLYSISTPVSYVPLLTL